MASWAAEAAAGARPRSNRPATGAAGSRVVCGSRQATPGAVGHRRWDRRSPSASTRAVLWKRSSAAVIALARQDALEAREVHRDLSGRELGDLFRSPAE